jgi:EAL domain-containing protein (putative c-di-GMP-specific phosphodiesterase class I)
MPASNAVGDFCMGDPQPSQLLSSLWTVRTPTNGVIMPIPTDLVLIFDWDIDSLAVLRALTERLGCDRIEVGSRKNLDEVLVASRPTIAVLAVDSVEADSLLVLQTLASYEPRPALFLFGLLNARVLASIRRAAEARGLKVIGLSSRPLDSIGLERVLATCLTTPQPIPQRELESAIAEHELTLEYQPKIALSSEGFKIQGVEALVRWQHPRRGLLHPHHFLHAFDHHGLLGGLTDFVITEALRQDGQWRTAGLPLEMVINLSPRLVQDREFPDRLASLLRENNVPPNQVALDVTESTVAEDGNLMLDVFTRLRILGVGLSLDNFGTGLSSLTDLYRMPYSEVKVDRSLLADVSREHEAQLIVRAIVDLAHTLQLLVCAEGVESQEVLEFALGAGFDSVQGRFFCNSVSATNVERFVKMWPSASAGVIRSTHGLSRQYPFFRVA